MNWLQRLTHPARVGHPTGQLDHEQRAFREQLAGRYVADSLIGAHAPAWKVHHHDDGTLDVTPLEANGAEWLDLGGRGGVDFAAGRF